MCKKILSVFLVALMLCTVFAPATSAYYQEDFKIVKGDSIKKIWYQKAMFWGQLGAVEEDRAIGGGVSVHYIDKNKNQKADRSELLICIERGTPSGSSVGSVKDVESMDDVPAWDNLSLSERRVVTKTLLNGYPNSSDNLGTGASKWEMFYATQILVWEFMSGERKYNDFSYEKNGPHESVGYGFEEAFIAQDVNDNEALSMTVKKGVFSDALAYYKKLLKKIEAHENKPQISGIDFSGKYKREDNNIVFEAKGSAPFTYTAKHKMFSNFTFESGDTSVATVSQSGDKLTIKIKKLDKTVKITGTKKNSQTNYKNPENNKLTPAVLVVSGTDGQAMMWGTGSLTDPVTFSFNVSAKQQYGGIGVYKVNSESLPLSDVKFGVYKTKDDATNKKNRVTTITTGTDGKGYYGGTTEDDFSLKEETTYYLRELDTQPGYELSDTVYSVEVVAGAVTFANSGNGIVNYVADEKGAIGIIKVDGSYNSVTYLPDLETLLGQDTSATFGLYADEECTILVDTAKTYPNGSNVVLGVDDEGNFLLESGRKYYVKEISAPYGLTPSDEVMTLSTEANKITYVNLDTSAEYEVNNDLGTNHDYISGGMKITPVSERTDVSDVSVTFQAFDWETSDMSDYLSTTKEVSLNETSAFYGVAKSTGNAIITPANSTLIAGEQGMMATVVFTYKDGSTNTIVVSYPAIAHRVVSVTVDDEAGWVNYDYAGIKVYKIDSFNEEPISDVTFGVYESFDDAKNKTNALKEITTDENGEAQILYSGKDGLIQPYTDENPYIYYVRELSAPDNFIVTDNIYPAMVGCVSGTFVMNKSDGTIEYITDEVYEDDYAEDENYIKVQESVSISGGLMGSVGDLLGGAPLVENQHYFASVIVKNEVVPTVKIIKHCVAGAGGFQFKLVNVFGQTLKVGSEGSSAEGKYFFDEWAFSDGNEAVEYEEVVLTTVADEDDNTIGYATLEDITLDKLYEEYLFIEDSDYPIDRTLFVVESVPSGYVSPNTETYDDAGATINHCGKIDFTESFNYEIEVENTPYTGRVVINKTVDTGSVEGWQFQVEYWQFKTLSELETYFEKEASDEEISEDEIAEYEPTYTEVYTTDADGRIIIDGLYKGVVRITELEDQEVDGYDGYYCDGEYSQMVELDCKYASETRNTKTVNFHNILRVFRIFKTDMYDYPLQGVEFSVYGSKEDAEAGAESSVVITTDENGWACFEGFGADVYFIKETKTLEGYQLSPEIYVLNNSMNDWENADAGEPDWEVINYIYAIHTGINDLGSVFSLLALPVALVVGTVGYSLYKKRKRKNLI